MPKYNAIGTPSKTSYSRVTPEEIRAMVDFDALRRMKREDDARRERKGTRVVEPVVPFTEPQQEIYQGLGTDYALVFSEFGGSTYTTTGRVAKPVMVGDKTLQARKLFYDPKDDGLKYTYGTSLFEFPNKHVKDFGWEAYGLNRVGGDLLVCLRGAGKIVDSTGELIDEDLVRPIDIRELKGVKYHVEGGGGNGLVRTDTKKSIKTTGTWTQGLDSFMDRLWFGGEDKKLYSSDGTTAEVVTDLKFYPWAIKGVRAGGKNLIYSGGEDLNGIGVVEVSDGGAFIGRSTLLEDLVGEVGAIEVVPINYLDVLHCGGKDG